MLRALGAISLLPATGCASFVRSSSDDGSDTTTTSVSTARPTETQSTKTELSADESTATSESRDTPGYKKYHWHGRLFFEVDGELVDFDQEKYYLENIDDDRPETVYFHFHDNDAHGPNEWSSEKKVITFAHALDLLPEIGYERRNGKHVVTYNGTTYREAAAGTDIGIYRGTERITPKTYEVQHNDNFWVRVDTDQGQSSESGMKTGKLIVDINNRRIDFSAKRYIEAGTSRFRFRDDGSPYRWYSDGTVTLAEALGSLPDIAYKKRSDRSVVKYSTDDDYAGVYRDANPGTEILTRQRATNIDPASYELQNGDILWVYVHSSEAPDNEH